MSCLKLIYTISFLLVVCVVFCQESHIYVSDAGNWSKPPWKILKFDLNGENPEIFTEEQMAWPQDILFLDDQGIVLISNLNSGRINKHDAVTGSYLGIFAEGLAGPTRMEIGPDRMIYVLQWSGDGKIARYTQNGEFVDHFSPVGVPQSIGLDWDQDGNLYVSSYRGDSVRKFDREGVYQGFFIDSDLAGPTNIWFGENGDLLVIDYDGSSVKRFTMNGTYKSEFLSGLSNAEGFDFHPNGHILVGNGKTHSVKEYDKDGTFVKDIIPEGSGGLKTPNAVVIH